VTAIVVMGVAGSGKSTVGRALATHLGVEFVEGDDLHSAEALAAMSAGRPLTEEERAPWLARLHDELAAHADDGVVVACSALTERARELLIDDLDVRLVWLHGDPQLIGQRLEQRAGHPIGVALLPSQLSTLEPPADALRLDVARPPERLVEQIVAWLDDEVYSSPPSSSS
jgi:carbohydrate kinase (thermoresistant glucokinase family)